jgi:hypothetical protein
MSFFIPFFFFGAALLSEELLLELCEELEELLPCALGGVCGATAAGGFAGSVVGAGRLASGGGWFGFGVAGVTVLLPTGASPVDEGAVFAGVSEPDVELGAGLEVEDALPFVPGVTVSTTAVVDGPFPDGEPPPADMLPGVNVSPSPSPSGVRLGAPVRAAVETSGPFRSAPSGLLIRLPRCRGKFCSFCIRANAVGSGWGTGAPNLVNLSFASAARGESG